MELLEFMENNPLLTTFGGFLVFTSMVLAFKSWNRFIRHLNIRKAGWPPDHLDADGSAQE